jgi:hypothetical protein
VTLRARWYVVHDPARSDQPYPFGSRGNAVRAIYRQSTSHFLRAGAAVLVISIGLLPGGTPRANAEQCPAETLYVVDSQLCVDSASQARIDPSCCTALKTMATNPDGSAKAIKLPKQCPDAPVAYVKQTGSCTSNGNAIDIACCDAIR